MPSFIIPLRPVAIPLAFLLLAPGCHRQPPTGRSATKVAPDSVQVGYGKQDKRDVTGAISEISGKDAQHGTVTSLADLLEGRVPGLEVTRLPDGSVSLRIRGDRSFNSSGEPLIVLDGIPLQGSNAILQDLDPREVASISVLKDAGSLAAYGSRGANGVIIITTNRR